MTTILIADDHAVVREGIRGLLRLDASFEIVAETDTLPQRSNAGARAADARRAGTAAHQKTRRSAVNTSIPTTIVPSMLRRHKNQPRPASAA